MDNIVTFRVSNKVKEDARAVLEKYNTGFSDLFRDVLEYVVETGQLPVSRAFLTNEDKALLAAARKKQGRPDKRVKTRAKK